MRLLSSLALAEDLETPATCFAASETHWAIGLADGSLKVLNADGQIVHSVEGDPDDEDRGFFILTIKDQKLFLLRSESKTLEIHDLATGFVAF